MYPDGVNLELVSSLSLYKVIGAIIYVPLLAVYHHFF